MSDSSSVAEEEIYPPIVQIRAMNDIQEIPNLIDHSKGEAGRKKSRDEEDSDSDEEGLLDDEEFNDPTADLKLLSRDDVVFRLSSWHLKKKSGFIRDMLEVTGAKHGIDDYIVLDVSATTLRYFFPCFYGNVNHFIDRNWSECVLLIKLADQFQAPEVETSLLIGMQHHGWPVFKIAAEKNLVSVGRACVRHFDKHTTPADSLPDIPYNHKAAMDALPTSWALGLLKCRLSEKYETEKGGVQIRTWRKRKWADGAEYFDA